MLAALGTDGDILPFAGVGAKLRERGHRVTLAAGVNYRRLAEDYGLEFRELMSQKETDDLLGNPDFWHPYKAPAHGARHGVRLIPRQYKVLRELAQEERTLIVANPAIFAAQMVQEKFGVPMASLILQPWILPSAEAPPVMPGLPFLRWSPRWLRKVFWRGLDWVGDTLVSRPLNLYRASLGLAPMQRVFSNWLSKELVIGMFPEWYGKRQKDWPEALRLVGFPMFSGSGGRGLELGLKDFCEAGTAPVAFTFGTGIRHARTLYHAAVDACERGKIRGVFITKFRDQLPRELPEEIYYTEHAPFDELFPLSQAVVHHGGIGTVAQALAAAKPQLVVPIAFDQLDNAARVKKMGAGLYIRSTRADGERIARGIKRLAGTKFQVNCERLSTHFAEANALELAADAVEELGRKRWGDGMAMSKGALAVSRS